MTFVAALLPRLANPYHLYPHTRGKAISFQRKYKPRWNPPCWLHCCSNSNMPQKAAVVDKLFLTRQQLNRCKRVLELSYRSNLEEVGLVEYGNPAEVVSVSLVVQKCGTSDYLIKSKVHTRLECLCDRCLNKFSLEVDGYFQLLLASKPNALQEWEDKEEEEDIRRLASSVVGFEDLDIEVWEPFTLDMEQVSLYSHVYDSILLSLPTKILCDERCPGIPIEEYQKNVVTNPMSNVPLVEYNNTTAAQETHDDNNNNRPVGWEDVQQLQVHFQNNDHKKKKNRKD